MPEDAQNPNDANNQTPPPAPAPTQPQPSKKSGYGKRPLWQWIVLYVIVAGILYFGIYYFFIHKSSSSTGSGTKTLQQPLY